MANRSTSWRTTLLGVSLLVGSTFGSQAAGADDPPETATVLGRLHHSSQEEVAAGKLAQESGKSHQVKAYGKMLEKDHGAADRKVTALAKKEESILRLQRPPKRAT